eukprot:g13998.t1
MADGALPKTSAVLFDERHKGLPDLRLVAMSATLSDRLASRLSGLLGGARVVRSEGREPGEPRRPRDVLCFLPGEPEIRRCQKLLEALTRLFAFEAQDLAVQPGEPGRRRVILATNVAEASITVSGVTSVVDSGLRKRSIFNSTTGFNRLELAAVSAASADQRRGRAGRVRDGLCLRLWAKGQKLVPEDVPAIGEEDLTGAILQLLSTGVP